LTNNPQKLEKNRERERMLFYGSKSKRFGTIKAEKRDEFYYTLREFYFIVLAGQGKKERKNSDNKKKLFKT